MLKNIKIITLFLLLQFSSTNLPAADIPVIVISPGKTPQSYNTVGSSVTVIDGKTINNSSDSFFMLVDQIWREILYPLII